MTESRYEKLSKKIMGDVCKELADVKFLQIESIFVNTVGNDFEAGRVTIGAELRAYSGTYARSISIKEAGLDAFVKHNFMADFIYAEHDN